MTAICKAAGWDGFMVEDSVAVLTDAILLVTALSGWLELCVCGFRLFRFIERL